MSDIDMDQFFFAVPEEEQQRERKKAAELRRSQWWKRVRGEGVCYYCEQRFPAKTLTMDHIVPIARGGRSTKSNLVACCKECNTSKKNMLPVEWQAYLDRQKAG